MAPYCGSQAHQPIDFSEKRELVSYRVRPGETLSDVLTRHNVSKAESLLWARTMTRNIGSETLPAGKEAHLFFSKSLIRGRGSLTQGQLKAVEIDQNDSFTLTLEKGIRGIFVQRREKPFDVELKDCQRIHRKFTFRRWPQSRRPPGIALPACRSVHLGYRSGKGDP